MALLEDLKPAATAEVPAPSRKDRSRLSAFAAFAVYVLSISLVISRHEPWFDEAQAWLIARDSNLWELFRILPYEGQPGLWHLILMLPSKLLPYHTINWISGALAAAGVYVFLRRSPFPTPLKVLVPFTFFLFYQYGVVARNYALLPLVLFLLAAHYPERFRRPARYAVLIFVLAATSTHGFLISAALLAIYAVEALREARGVGRRWPDRAKLLAVVAPGLGMGVLALGLIPPKDRTFATMGPHLVGPQTFVDTVRNMLNHSLVGNRLLLIGVLGASIWFLRSRRVLHLYAVPTALLLLFFAFVHNAAWHEGVLFLVWLFALWVGLQRKGLPEEGSDWSRKLALGAVLVVSVVQINWTVRTAILEYGEPYSGSRAMAAYLKENVAEEETIFGYHWASIALNPYFEGNIFDNYNPPGKPSYWWWSERNHMVQDFDLIEALQPDYVVYPIKVAGMQDDAFEGLPSYRQTVVFWGELFWKGGTLQPDVYILFERRS